MPAGVAPSARGWVTRHSAHAAGPDERKSRHVGAQPLARTRRLGSDPVIITLVPATALHHGTVCADVPEHDTEVAVVVARKPAATAATRSLESERRWISTERYGRRVMQSRVRILGD